MKFLKHAFYLFLALAVAAGATGCVSFSSGASAGPVASSNAIAFTEADALAATESVYMHLVNGTFDDIIDMLDESVKPQLTGNALEEGYQSQVAPNGAFEAIASNKASAANNTFTVVLVAQHADGQSQLTCVFSQEGKITGIGVADLSATADTADPIPLALPEGAEERAVTLHAGTEKELTGALILPKGATPDTPVVVMAQGSGVSDLDETVGPNKPFRDIAYGLAENGIATIRYDKLHFAHPELATADITVDDEYTGTVLEALAVVRAEADLGRAYMLGHSEGGMLTPYLMKQSDGKFYGGIILAGTPRQLWELIYDQNLAVLEGSPEETIAAATVQLEAEKDKLATLDEMSEDELRTTTVFGIPGPYLAHLSRIDALSLAHENNAPLLILQGEDDFQVSLDVDYAAWKEGLADMGSLVTYKSYPGLSHLFMPATGSIKDPMNAYATPELVDEGVISDIAEWINAQ